MISERGRHRRISIRCRSPTPSLRTALGLEGKTVLGFAGSFYAYEGLDLLLEAPRCSRRAVPNCECCWSAAARRKPRCRSAPARPASPTAWSLPAACRTTEVQRYYELIDVLAYPRRRMRLTELVTPLKPLEAMAQGRMFVASDVGGHRELIRDGETGFLFPAGDAGALAHAIESCSRRRDEWPRLQAQARRYVETERTWARSVARYRGRICGGCVQRGHGRRPIAPTEGHSVMCGIYGILQLDGTRPCRRCAAAAWRKSRSIAAPTTKALMPTGRCAIGMRRLSIIDLAGGHQPLTNEDGTLWLVCNGEIYNYRELRAQARHVRASIPDGLRLRDDPASLRGAWRRLRAAPQRHVRVRAVGRAPPASADRPRPRSASSRSTCRRRSGRLIFASEAKALLALPGMRAAARSGRAAILPGARLRAGAAIDLRGIRKLPPATLLIARARPVRAAPLLARPCRGRRQTCGGRMGSRVFARGSRSRCGCRW